MKNFIPLVLAVLLGLAAVIAVSQILNKNQKAQAETIAVVWTTRDLNRGDVITDSSIAQKEVAKADAPVQAILWSRANTLVGQKALNPVRKNNYVLTSDVDVSNSNVAGIGEWAVSLTLPPTGITRMIQAGDEVAVIGTFKTVRKVRSTDLSAAAKEVQKEATLVLFPKVRVLDVGGMQGAERGEGGGSILLALPAAQAQMLIAAQRQGELSLALRRPNDESNLNRADIGLVDDESFAALLDGVESVVMPKIPSAVEKEKAKR